MSIWVHTCDEPEDNLLFECAAKRDAESHFIWPVSIGLSMCIFFKIFIFQFSAWFYGQEYWKLWLAARELVKEKVVATHLRPCVPCCTFARSRPPVHVSVLLLLFCSSKLRVRPTWLSIVFVFPRRITIQLHKERFTTCLSATGSRISASAGKRFCLW